MAYELKRGGTTAGVFGTEQEAVKAASAIIRDDADAELAIIDTTTGQPVAPGADGASREDLAGRVGF